MYLETILIASIIGIFMVIARRLPESFRVEETVSDYLPATSNSPVVQAAKSTNNVFKNIFAKFRIPPFKFSRKPAIISAVQLQNNYSLPAKSTIDIRLSNNSNRKENIVSEEDLLKEGDKYLETGKLREAERSYLRAVAKNPANPKLYNRLGIVYLKQRNFHDTLEAFEAACNLDPAKSTRHYNVALAAWELKNLSKAREAINNALALEPNADKYKQLKQLIEQV